MSAKQAMNIVSGDKYRILDPEDPAFDMLLARSIDAFVQDGKLVSVYHPEDSQKPLISSARLPDEPVWTAPDCPSPVVE